MINVRILLFIWALTSLSSTNAQDSLRHYIYAEFGGVGYYGSMNYEYSMYPSERIIISPRIGLSAQRLNDYNGRFNPDIVLPIGIHIRNNHRFSFDCGIGALVLSTVSASSTEPSRATSVGGFASIGGRFNSTKGIMIRIAYTPLFTSVQSFVNWAGVSVGYSFK